MYYFPPNSPNNTNYNSQAFIIDRCGLLPDQNHSSCDNMILPDIYLSGVPIYTNKPGANKMHIFSNRGNLVKANYTDTNIGGNITAQTDELNNEDNAFFGYDCPTGLDPAKVGKNILFLDY